MYRRRGFPRHLSALAYPGLPRAAAKTYGGGQGCLLQRARAHEALTRIRTWLTCLAPPPHPHGVVVASPGREQHSVRLGLAASPAPHRGGTNSGGGLCLHLGG